MLSTIHLIEVFIYLALTEYKWLFILLYIVAHAVYTYYFWMNGVKFPILGILPFARVFLYRSMSGLSVVLIAPYCVFSALALYLPSMLIWIIWLVISFVLELSFARGCIDDKQLLFALCPPYKLVRLYMDAKALK